MNWALGELWIIESGVKAQTLETVLRRNGLADAVVQSTKGHIMAMPAALAPVGMDVNLHEFMRVPLDIERVKRIRDMAKEASRVVIATDADQEGDVIAWDVADLISDVCPDPVRVRLKGVDDESVMEASANPAPVRKEDAIPGRTRAIVDRLIGCAFSSREVAVGRVGTAMLGLVARDRPCVVRLNLSAPAKDGGRPWLASVDVKPPLTEEVARRLAATPLPVLDKESDSPLRVLPPHTGDILVRASERLDITPKEAMVSMQKEFEAGRLSYPRANSRGMSRAASRKLSRIMAKAASQYRFDSDKIEEKKEGETHDSPYPIGRVDMSVDPRKMGSHEGVRMMIARDLVRCGQTHVRERPVGAVLESYLASAGFPPEVARKIAGLDWHRDRGPRYPDQESWTASSVVRRRPDAVLLEACVAVGLGRPSTWGEHIDKFMKRGLVDDNLNLTRKGRDWIAASPPNLLDPRISVAVERACEKMVTPDLFTQPGREPWEVLAERITKALPPEIRGAMRALVDGEAPQVRRDFKALMQPGFDFDALPKPSRLTQDLATPGG